MQDENGVADHHDNEADSDEQRIDPRPHVVVEMRVTAAFVGHVTHPVPPSARGQLRVEEKVKVLRHHHTHAHSDDDLRPPYQIHRRHGSQDDVSAIRRHG